MKIAIVTSHMTSGGAQKIIAELSNHWVGIEHEVTVVSLDRASSFYRLRKEVRFLSLDLNSQSKNAAQALLANMRRLRVLRKTIQRLAPDFVLSFTVHTNVRVLLATCGLSVPVAVAERTNPWMLRLSLPWQVGRRLSYSRAAAVFCLTDDAAQWIRRFYRGDVFTIPNPVEVSSSECNSILLPGGARILAVGRLHPVKQFHRLIQTFACLASDFPDWSLLIVGEGPARPQLETLIAALSLTDKVHLLGQRTDVADVMRQCQIFTLTSEREGFPNALAEAMACGMAVISFDCPSGPGFLINHGVDGILLPQGDWVALENSLRSLIENKMARIRLGSQAFAVLKRFAAPKVLGMWDSAIDRIAGNARRFPAGVSAESMSYSSGEIK